MKEMIANRLILISVYELAILVAAQYICFKIIFFDRCWATGFVNMDQSITANEKTFLTYKVQYCCSHMSHHIQLENCRLKIKRLEEGINTM
ncbi:uncharacterized protein BKA55DRAFT_572576 [Fusarium redolens]|uniref:Uncharacterized protein n=1 Tax=Fusarium redolens TaxID=48865 RepID=A0A9P9KC49_FUSRE|nr:uncharacterized protein BKA55DRAFT_572576 [Fusarium redolens]KAH7247619.1 hypothetical protein BKA55DRAFT_572576 [Fusarium redolens]